MRHREFNSIRWVATLVGVLGACPRVESAQTGEPIAYTVKFSSPEKHFAEVEAIVRTDNQASIELFMPVWSPGFYRVEDYASRIESLEAKSPGGMTLEVEHPQKNRWRIKTGGNLKVVVSYRLKCDGRSVTTNWVGDDLGVLNGAPTFLTFVGTTRRPHDVTLRLPPKWTRAWTALDPSPDGLSNHYRAVDYDTLVDSPIVAGNASVHEFVVDGSKHFLVDIGDVGLWDGQKAVQGLEKIVRENRRFWGVLPFQNYYFLNVFRRGGGGLEHKNSTLLTTNPPRIAGAESSFRWYSFVSHEYFHAFNVKRLRPVELGPFDYEKPPRTSSLWISEGLTTYFGELIVIRAGLGKTEDFLKSISSHIGQLQNAPGRLVQSLEQSSLDVWSGGTSGIGRDRATAVSYYVKGPVVGFLLDAKIRRATADRKNFGDVMRLAYKEFSGERGFTAEQFRSITEAVAGVDLKEWFRRALASTEELEYHEALDWYGIRFAPAAETAKKTTDEPATKVTAEPAAKSSEKSARDSSREQAPRRALETSRKWRLEIRPDATDAQQAHLRSLLSAS